MKDLTEFEKLKRITGLVKESTQNDKAVKSKKEDDINIKELILNFIPSSKMIHIEELMIEGNYNGFEDSEIKEEIERLKKSGNIIIPKKGYLQKK